MGLLDRASTLKRVKQSEGSDKTVSSFSHSPNHIDFPAEVFKTFQSLIGFTKGSLMLPDSRGEEYYPWISIGFDRTTTRRLKIPLDFPALMNDDSTYLEIDPDNLAQMLSNRELGLTRKILMIRMGESASSSALLLISDSSLPGDINSEMILKIQKLSKKFGDGIKQSRLMLDSSDNEEITDLTEWIEGWGDKNAILVTLDITSIIDSFINTIPGLELYRGRRDIISLIRHITGRMGRLHDLKDGRVLILFPPERLPDYDLYLHQLSHSVASAFYNLSPPPEIPADFRIWPDEKKAIEENLSGFF